MKQLVTRQKNSAAQPVMSNNKLTSATVSDHDSDDLDNLDNIPIKRRVRSKSVPKLPSAATTAKVNAQSRGKRERKASKLNFCPQELDLDDVNAELSTLNI